MGSEKSKLSRAIEGMESIKPTDILNQENSANG